MKNILPPVPPPSRIIEEPSLPKLLVIFLFIFTFLTIIIGGISLICKI